jgi:hypothetical protein
MSNTHPGTRRPATAAAPASSCQGRRHGEARKRTRIADVRTPDAEPDVDLLAGYLAATGRSREIICCQGLSGSRLVIDRDRLTRGDRRLLAHLASDEPIENAKLVCDLYLGSSERSRCRCVVSSDLRSPLPTELQGQALAAIDEGLAEHDLCEARGVRYLLAMVPGRASTQELRWCRQHSASGLPHEPVSVREVVGAIESYEPVRRLTATAIQRHRRGRRMSVATLCLELHRLNTSPTVLNRGLREAALHAVDATELSMSEIALRCGRVKRDRRGFLSGETTWLARRLGLVCEGGAALPSPWVHSEVLALIAREGLGIPPREAELA